MIMDLFPVVYLEKDWPPLHGPTVKEGWCKLCADARVLDPDHRVTVEFAGGWRFTYEVCPACYAKAFSEESVG